VRVGITLPTDRVDRMAEFVSPDAVAEIAQAAERAGFDSIGVADHPFPPDDWLEHGNGHHDLEPLVVLAFAAAATSTIRLRMSLYIAAYRNPFLAAKGIASLDVLSGGRVVLGIGTGYLAAESEALGMPFEDRNERTDEAIVAMRKAWTEDHVHFVGRHFAARGHTMLPKPVQPGGPPIWIGGNAKRAIRRAVEHGAGWLPMPYRGNAVSRRTAPMTSFDDLRAMLDYAAAHAAKVGRTEPLGLSFGLGTFPIPTTAPDPDDALVEAAEHLAGLGVTDTGFPLGPYETRAELLDRIAGAADLVARLKKVPTTGVTFS